MRAIILSLIWMTVSMAVNAQAPTRVENWPFKTPHGQGTLDNLPALSMKETIDSSMIFFGTAVTYGLYNFHFDKSNFEGWPLFFDTILMAGTPLIADVDHDGEMEIIINGTKRDWNHHYVHME